MHLPAEYRDFPGQAVDLHLTGVIPADKEDEWDQRVTKIVMKTLDRHLKDESGLRDNIHVEAKIVVPLKDALLVESIRVVEYLPDIETAGQKLSVKKFLITNKYGVADSRGIAKMKDLVQQIGEFIW